jgi:hypothetical protein
LVALASMPMEARAWSEQATAWTQPRSAAQRSMRSITSRRSLVAPLAAKRANFSR